MPRTKRPTTAPPKSAQASRTRTKKPPTTAAKKPTKPASRKPKAPAAKKKPTAKNPKTFAHKNLFFHHESDPHTGFLAPWFPSPFSVRGTKYLSAGHFIMAEKARVSKDTKTLAAILASKSAAEQKELGNKVKGFEREVWGEHAYTAAITANEHKFLHGPGGAALRERLVPYVQHNLTYASPTDGFFGIGLSEEDAGDPSDLANRRRWGRNLFGHALAGVKERTWREAFPKEAKRKDREWEERDRERVRHIDELVHW